MTAWDMGATFDRDLDTDEWIPVVEAFVDGCGGLIVRKCPWCGKRHYHGDGEGAAQCKGRPYVLRVSA